MNLVRGYDHILGESWTIEDGGYVLGMFFGAGAKTRAEKRMEQVRHKPHPLQRTIEARAVLLERLRKADIHEDMDDRTARARWKAHAYERRTRRRR